jgi:hypothetical protein
MIINDSTVLVDLLIKKDVQQFIRADCIAGIGSSGIIGDRVLIVTQGSNDAAIVKNGQHIQSKEPVETSEIISSLKITADNAAIISDQLFEIMININSGRGTLGKLIQDSTIAENFNQSIANLNKFSKGLAGSDILMKSLNRTAENAEDISHKLSEIINKINRGDGTLGRLIRDTTMVNNLNLTILNLRKSSEGFTGTDTIMAKINITAVNAAIISKQLTTMMYNINEGNGTFGRLIRDTILAENLNQTLIYLKKGSKGLDDNMEAAKHNFFLRGFFNKKAKAVQQKKDDAAEEKKEKLKKEKQKK